MKAPPSALPVLDAREATVGMSVRRLFPQKARSPVGAWCFFDHYGPVMMTGQVEGIGPHPHSGLQTFSWLLEGEMLHGDSIGSEQSLLPGELNVMTAGEGIVHWEDQRSAGWVHGAQLWIALPDEARHCPPAFEHHAELPVVEHSGGRTRVLIGEHADQRSPATAYTPLLGLEVTLSQGSATTLPLAPTFEHAVAALSGSVTVNARGAAGDSRPGRMVMLACGHDEVELVAGEQTTFLVLGGEPWDEPLLMWWNFVGRHHDEMVAARAWWEELREHQTWPTTSKVVPAPPIVGRLRTR
jgi:redox-sensitive bicupin YhaK (pirin superfamily)